MRSAALGQNSNAPRGRARDPSADAENRSRSSPLARPIPRKGPLCAASTVNMAITTDIKLSRSDDAQPWGFRLSGGLDFTFPLTAVKVAIGSLAHAAGLQAGDIIVGLNGEPISQLIHAQVHDKLISAGNDVVLSVVRNHEIAQRQQ